MSGGMVGFCHQRYRLTLQSAAEEKKDACMINNIAMAK
jgi:hypothetical protein